MNSQKLPQDLLRQIASIDRMERGKLSVFRRSSGRSYCNLQRREGGRNATEYVPADQVAQAQQNVDAYHRFESLVGQYVDSVSAKSRQERLGGNKKKRPSPPSPSPKKPKSKT
jgi:hypothetical protein